ncbi:phytanoyl-CoA dioxygenase family protein [Mucilaginibacter sp. L3T2-6]|uniref:phytanoyl-CoA dioxygenase family protein n=1 Tax=Mucilaginibacter sp. L3T2-6 TaxID=3062491 RepID=UPI0026764365|nr:phytanoyl-CoA dioxygenase family protein [Mucilaginibacter sp. L3T2-6]MDO3644480.1 phytanoyl-CoA dioxygenase family protein [Mucilaginibacter sp. L3T2-6]MDV6216932.1 phytanoyl-CoA dioxygenase family protein [Mucilaginibacter sp. L3T2-6]
MVTANLPWVESPFFEEAIKSKKLTAKQAEIAETYHRDGFVVLQGVLSESLIDAVLNDAKTKAFNPDFRLNTQRDEVRVQDFWQVSEAARELACHPEILKTLEFLYEREVIPFQTLNFSVGTQQRAHSDTIHFSSLPARFMCGVWVALEDITEENGPVFYYPGSHTLPEYDFSHIGNTPVTTSYENYKEYEDFIEKIVEANKLEKRKFLAKKGDLLIWSSNIIHGGSPVTKQGASRWSQVTHYFFADCYYYTPMLSNMVTRELFLRNGLKNIKTGEEVVQSYNGKKFHLLPTAKKLYFLSSHLKVMPNIVKTIKNLWK